MASKPVYVGFPSPSLSPVDPHAYWSRFDSFPETREPPKRELGLAAIDDDDDDDERDEKKDAMYLINCQHDTTVAKLSGAEGLAASSELGAYLRVAASRTNYFGTEAREFDQMRPAELASSQALLWNQVPRYDSVCVLHPADIVSEREQVIANRVRLIADTLAQSPQVFVVQEQKHDTLPSCLVLHEDKGCRHKDDVLIALEPLLDPATLHPMFESVVLKDKVLVFHRNFTKYERMGFHAAKTLVPEPVAIFCSDCLAMFWDQRELSWCIMDRGRAAKWETPEPDINFAMDAAELFRTNPHQRMASEELGGQLDGSVRQDQNTPAASRKAERRDSARTHLEPAIHHPTRQARPLVKAGGVSRKDILDSAHRATHGNTMHAAPSYDFDDTEELMPGLQSGKITDQQHDGGPPGRVYNAILENVLKTATLAPAQESSVASKVPIGAQDRMSNSSMPQATSVSSLASNAPLLSRPALPQHLVPKPIYCYCQRPDNGSRMVQCTNENCSVQWVHLQCMNKAQRLSTKHPAVKWVCDVCKTAAKFEKQGSRANDNLSSKFPFEKQEVINALAYPGGTEGVKDPYGMSAFKPAGIAWEEPTENEQDGEDEEDEYDEEEYGEDEYYGEDEDMEGHYLEE